MKKLELSDFIDTELSNRILTALEDCIQVTAINGGDGRLYVFHYPPGEVRDTHSHPEIRLTFIRSGRMRFTLEGVTRELSAGDFVSTLPGIPHRLEVIGDDLLHLIEIAFPVKTL